MDVMKKTHTLKVNLSADDWEDLKSRAELYNTSVSFLIESFVKDLVYSKESNGSDERRLANDWFNRSIWNYKEV